MVEEIERNSHYRFGIVHELVALVPLARKWLLGAIGYLMVHVVFNH